MKAFAKLSCMLAIVAVSGCGPGRFSPATTAHTGILRYALTVEPITYDPGRVQDSEMIELLSNVYEGLVAYDEKNRAVPQLAESVTPLDGGRVWVFKIRKDARFQDGKPVQAQDFKWTWERNLNSKFGSPIALSYLGDIKGADDVAAGKTDLLAGVQVPDERTLRVTLAGPRAYFLGKLTYPCAFVLEPGIAGTTPISDVAHSVGTGPFRIASISPQQQVLLEANPSYYLGRPKVSRIERPILKDAPTRLNKFRSGELDMLTLERQDVKSVQADPVLGPQLRFEPRPTVYYIGLNQHAYPPFQDVRVRRAFALAVDRNQIDGVLLQGMPPAHGMIPNGVIGFRSDYPGMPYDPTQARTLLAASGHPNGAGLPPIDLYFQADAPDAKLVGQGAQISLQQVGFKISLQQRQKSVLFDMRNKGQLPTFFFSWVADYPDPQNFLSFLLTTGSQNNHERYSNPEFDKICAEADSTTDPARRIQLYDKAEDVLIGDAARVPLYFGRDAVLMSPRISGLRENLMGNLPLLWVSVQ